LPPGIKICSIRPLLGATLAHACAKPFLTYGEGPGRLQGAKVSFALEQVALDIIISTGLVSNFTSGGDKYYYNSNLAHCVYCGATLVPPAASIICTAKW
jgi:hypothetical protein